MAGQIVDQGEVRQDAIHKRKKKNNETKSGASWEELGLEIKGRGKDGLDVGDLARSRARVCSPRGPSHVDETAT